MPLRASSQPESLSTTSIELPAIMRSMWSRTIPETRASNSNLDFGGDGAYQGRGGDCFPLEARGVLRFHPAAEADRVEMSANLVRRLPVADQLFEYGI